MPDISEQTLIPAPLGVVWPLLSDPAEVAACIPGAQLAPSTGDGLWRGSIKVKFGPTVAAFRGEAKLDYDHDAHRCSIEGRGIDQRGASRALANGEVLAAAEGNSTRLTVNGSFTVTGPLETFANAGGVHVARALLAEFANNMANRAMAAAPAAAPTASDTGADAPSMAAAPAAPPAPPPPAPAAEINAFGLLWRAFLSWISGLFGKGNK
ncbi:MAG: SRPBCC family protein [Roseomonas sp.]|nr:SRPBCC family protein [Roseomonas sp.]MCA3306645.1 SRPBCC family protein [Roseomonas sp.]MCA3311371.1 SRPBCC family protein [Roseomonas sp.]MCA3313352.1 SRPBCC family protein [Roseomonas sp.]MCA3317117.1 SRPBCC family protein [Roseomonas sp.]